MLATLGGLIMALGGDPPQPRTNSAALCYTRGNWQGTDDAGYVPVQANDGYARPSRRFGRNPTFGRAAGGCCAETRGSAVLCVAVLPA